MKKQIKDFKEQYDKLCEDLYDAYVLLMNKHNTNIANCGLSDSPIILYHTYCDDNYYTLDNIVLCDDGCIKFGCSSCFSSTDVYTHDLDLDLLIEVYEWVIYNEDEIFNED